MKENIRIIGDIFLLNKMKEYYKQYLKENNGEYIYFFALKDEIAITAFNGKKEEKKIMFQGENARQEAEKWSKNIIDKPRKKAPQENFLCLETQIGSDEVGVGDLFLPLIVVSAYITKEGIEKLQELGVHDSKKLLDKKILEIGPKLIDNFDFVKLVLHNEKYNEMILKGENINTLKAKMHNEALYLLLKRHPDVNNIFVDQFVNEKKYYSYLENENHLVTKITFKEKGESYYPSVALASVMARYSFLQEKIKIEKILGESIPLGASKAVDDFLIKLSKRMPKEQIQKLVKMNFKNYASFINKDYSN